MTPATAELAATELHRGPLTFMGAPYGHDLSAAKAAILGAPFDCGIHLFRIGARQGPQSIREQSRLVRPVQSAAGRGARCRSGSGRGGPALCKRSSPIRTFARGRECATAEAPPPPPAASS